MNTKAPKYRRVGILPYSVFSFYFSTLLDKRGRIRLSTIIAATVITGVLSIATVPFFNWLFFVSLIGFVLCTWFLFSDYLRTTNLEMRESNDIHALCANISPSNLEKDAGYKTCFIANRNDAIMVSKSVNEHLRRSGHEIAITVRDNYKDRIASRLTNKADDYRRFLICQYKKSRNDRKMFFNDAKISLLTTLLPNTTELTIFRSSYYLSFLTNDLCAVDVEDTRSNKAEPSIVWLGKDNFPYVDVLDGKEIKTLENSLFSNHLGGNTIGFSQDKFLTLWRQGKSSQRSVGLLAPTGSGSLDWRDYSQLNERTLSNIIIRGIERELLEESHKENTSLDKVRVSETKLIGFFRWIGKGGLPGFLAVTKLHSNYCDLFPNVSEVDNPDKIKTCYPANDLAQLRSTVALLLEQPNISVPLYANLLSLRFVIEDDPRYLDFLF